MRAKVLFLSLAVAAVCSAKDIKTVVLNTAPEMHCSNCENKIKSNIRFEKGVKDIQTNLDNKTVTITYDADKTSVANIIAGFKKIDYVATVASANAEAAPQAEQKQGGCCGSGGCKCGQKKAEAAPQAEKKQGCCGGGGCKSAQKKAEAAPQAEKEQGGCKCGQKKTAEASVAANGSVVKYKASQMSCGGCANKVTNLLKGVDGVQDVAVNLETKVVTVSYDAAKTDAAKIKDSFKTINYTVEDVQ